MTTIAEALVLNDGTGYRYAQSYQASGLVKHLAADQPRYWGLLTNAQLAHLC